MTRVTGPSGRSWRSACRRQTPRSSSTGTTICCEAAPPGLPRRSTRQLIEDFVDRVAEHLDSSEAALVTEVINRNASAHFVGGIPIGENSERRCGGPLSAPVRSARAARDGRQRDASKSGVNPSLMITALAERAMSLWPNKGRRRPEATVRLRLRARERRSCHIVRSCRPARRASCGSTRRSPT